MCDTDVQTQEPHIRQIHTHIHTHIYTYIQMFKLKNLTSETDLLQTRTDSDSDSDQTQSTPSTCGLYVVNGSLKSGLDGGNFGAKETNRRGVLAMHWEGRTLVIV